MPGQTLPDASASSCNTVNAKQRYYYGEWGLCTYLHAVLFSYLQFASNPPSVYIFISEQSEAVETGVLFS